MAPFPLFEGPPTMYAIIRTGGKQAKVQEGDVLDVERLRADDEVTFTPLLVVDDKGTVISSRDQLKSATVVAKIVGASAGPKLDIFKYKNKTGYRRQMGHRQKYTRIEVTKIDAPGAERVAAEAPAATAKAVDAEPAAKKASTAAAKPAAKKASTAAKPAAKKAAATKKPAAAKSPAAKKAPAAKKTTKSAKTDKES